MPKNTVWLIIATLIFFIALLVAYKFFLVDKQADSSKTTAQTSSKKQNGIKTTIRMTEDGFSPEEITVSKGDTVVWVNEDTDYRWPASDLHPTHMIYPEFDPREPFNSGESWSFIFDKVGNWKYHDHLKSNKKGLIVVKE